jgi:hypothetical protein
MFGLTPATFPQEQIEAATDACTRGEFEANTETYRVFGDDFIASFAAGITSSAQAGGVSTQIAAIKLRNLIIRPPVPNTLSEAAKCLKWATPRLPAQNPTGEVAQFVTSRQQWLAGLLSPSTTIRAGLRGPGERYLRRRG